MFTGSLPLCKSIYWARSITLPPGSSINKSLHLGQDFTVAHYPSKPEELSFQVKHFTPTSTSSSPSTLLLTLDLAHFDCLASFSTEKRVEFQMNMDLSIILQVDFPLSSATIALIKPSVCLAVWTEGRSTSL